MRPKEIHTYDSVGFPVTKWCAPNKRLSAIVTLCQVFHVTQTFYLFFNWIKLFETKTYLGSLQYKTICLHWRYKALRHSEFISSSSKTHNQWIDELILNHIQAQSLLNQLVFNNLLTFSENRKTVYIPLICAVYKDQSHSTSTMHSTVADICLHRHLVAWSNDFQWAGNHLQETNIWAIKFIIYWIVLISLI